ncbi:MAG: hypothetical protein J6V82_02215 [Clostridia bacterium]|nr:hypothetical protein [Clostridia bacterium]
MKSMKFSAKLSAFILCVSMVLSLCTVFAFGEEAGEVSPIGTTSATPDLVINSAQDLIAFAAAVNGGDAFVGKVVALGGNIDLTDVAWTPIGTAEHPFSGTFDGAGHTVSNLIYKGSAQVYGFFGVIAGATVQNLSVAGSIESTYASNNVALGGIAAQANSRTDENSVTTNSSVLNCENFVSIKYWQSVDGYNIFAAGIVAWAYAGTTVQNCTNNASISAGNNKDKRGSFAGGIVAFAEGASGSTVTIMNCENLAEVSINSKLTNGNYTNIASPIVGAGGIAGKLLFAKIQDCTNKGKVASDCGTANKAICGGIAGLVLYGSSVKLCVNEGAVEASQIAGGIVAALDDYDKRDQYNPIYINSCINNGSVTATGQFVRSTLADSFAGGICGYVRANSSSGTKVYFEKNMNTATVSGKGAVSGIVCIEKSQILHSVKNCINAGDVVGIYNAKAADIYVSGAILVRSSNKGEFQYCMNIGRVILRDERADKTVAEKKAIVGAFAAQNANSKIKNTYYLENIIIDETIQPIVQADGTTLEICSELKITNTSNKNAALSETDNAVEKFNTLLGTAYSHWYQGVEAPLPTYEAYIAEAKVRGASVGLADALSLSFFVLNKGAMRDLELAVSCVAANGANVPLEKAEEGEYLRYTVADITAIDMDSVYTVKVQTSEGETVSALSYSILEYAVNKYDSADEELNALLEAMMYYGNAAQANKGEATLLAAFAQATGYEASETYVQDAYDALSLHKIENAAEDVAWIGEGMVALKLDEYVRPFLQVDGVASVTVDFNGISDIPCEETSSYFIIDCLYAPSLEDGFCIKAYDEDGGFIGQITYSVATYVLNLLENEDATDTEITLAKALAVYMNQAKVYKLSH